MPRIARTLAGAVGLVGAVAASQGPEFAQQYRQRLGGAIDELRRVVVRFGEDARAAGQSRDAAIDELRRSPDRLASLQGEAMRAHVERLERLERQRLGFAEAGPFGRLALLLRDGDAEIAAAAYHDFEPALPATKEGLVAALLGFLAGYALSRAIGLPLRRLLMRNRRRQSAARPA